MHPILWSWGPITLYSYGAALAIAVLLAARLAARRASTIGATPTQIVDLVLWIMLGGIVGARLVYVAQQWPIYAADLFEILRLDHGGLVFYGGLAGGTLTALLVIRRMRLSAWRTLDLLMPAVALGQAIGRIGCFLNGCCYGEPTTAPWGVRFPGEAFARHPTQLYESAALFLLAGLLLRRARPVRHPAARGAMSHGARRPAAPGTILAWYLIGYGAWRFAVEFLRGDNPSWLWGLTFSQVVSVPLVLLGLWWLRRDVGGQSVGGQGVGG